MGVSAICVRRRRYQYELFNFSVNKFISGVNPYNLGVNNYPNGVNPVSRVIQTIWCDCLYIVNITLFWCVNYKHGVIKQPFLS